MIPKVDNWERKNQKDAYIYSDGKNIKINIKKAIPNSSKRFSKEDLEATESLETFIIERRLFLKRIDIIAQHIVNKLFSFLFIWKRNINQRCSRIR